MKQFFKFVFASTLGFILAVFLVFLISVSVVAGIIMTGNREFALQENSVFHLKLSGEIIERSQPQNLDELFSLTTNRPQMGLDDILENIKKAKNDDRIKGILLEAGLAQISISAAKEIRDALLEFRESGKFIVATGGLYTQTLYYIASVANKIILNPAGSVEFRGLASTATFYRNALDRLGVEVQLIKVGTYKSFAEQYTTTQMSEENRRQVSAYINCIWNTMLEDISASRNISKENLNKYADRVMTFQSAEKILSLGLVDSLLYADQINSILAYFMGVSEEEDIQLVTLNQLKTVPHITTEIVEEKIAIVYAVGAIDGASTIGGSNINSRRLVEILQEIKENDQIKAVVLRINSPGGAAYGSEQIWRAVSLLREKKPVVVSMGNLAASGGYYIAVAANAIVAQPTTLTGSIGIFGLIPNIEGLTDKIGINFDVVKTNQKSDILSINRALTEQERHLIQMYVSSIYDLFLQRVAEGRNKTIDEVKQLAEGRVWSGRAAKELGLVDELGGIQTALNLAAQKAEIENFTIVRYPKQRNFMEKLMENLSNNLQARILQRQLGENYRHFINLRRATEASGIKATMPFEISVN